MNAKFISSLRSDLALILENWSVAVRTLSLLEQLSQERQRREQLYQHRVDSLCKLVTGMAHEINTPLGVMSAGGVSFKDILTEITRCQNIEPDLLEDAALACKLVNNNAQRISTLVERFKLLSQAQHLDSRTHTDLLEVIEDAVESFKPKWGNKGIDVRIESDLGRDIGWTGYAKLLDRTLVSLLENVGHHAYKSEGGIVELRVVNARPDRLGILVNDFGTGVNESIRDTIFDPFVTDARSRGHVGLGLSIAHTIVTNVLGGSIEDCEKEGPGAMFAITIPREVSGGG